MEIDPAAESYAGACPAANICKPEVSIEFNASALPSESIAVHFFALFFCLFLTHAHFAPAQASDPHQQNPASVQDYILAAKDDDAKCRGRSGAEAEINCQIRDVYSKNLNALGYCYGKKDQINADMTWDLCASDSPQSEAAPPTTDCLSLPPIDQLQCHALAGYKSTYEPRTPASDPKTTPSPLPPLPEKFYSVTLNNKWTIGGFADLHEMKHPVCVASTAITNGYAQILVDQVDRTIALYAQQKRWEWKGSLQTPVEFLYYNAKLKPIFRSGHPLQATLRDGDAILISGLTAADLLRDLNQASALEIFFTRADDSVRIYLGNTKAVFAQLDACSKKFKSFAPLDVQRGGDLDWRKTPQFRTPSNQIHCMFVGDEKKSDPSGVACDINQSFVRIPIRPRPKDCNLDWGQRFELGADSDAGLGCASDWVGSEDSPFLTYGNSVRAGKIVCKSEETGLTCKNADGHGFFLSRRSQRIF